MGILVQELEMFDSVRKMIIKKEEKVVINITDMIRP